MKRPGTDEADDVGALSLYDRFATTIFDYLSQQLASREDAEDLLVEVFLAAHNQPMLFPLSDERQLAWLRRVAKNKVVDHYRHHAVVRMLPLEQALCTVDRALTPEQRAMQREDYERLYQAIGGLSLEQQQLIHLRYGCELRLVAIADLLERPEGTLRKMLARTLLKLRTLYEQTERGARL
ncbi:MAG: sigma-70 family RNA polymerase sigma factor [Chloroflexota bacterium]|nr:sigma-70 family RNA polymerase sigma factor [Chloroflexota bacterium]